MSKNAFSENLQRMRKEKGYTQNSFAEAVGLKRNTIACYETERRECDFDTLLLFSETLECTIDELLKGPQNKTKKHVGVIYILTNPSFPEYVKIGYADDVDKRLQQLNRSESIPFAFRVYATYEVDSRLSDVKIHSIIDKLNPNLRAIDVIKGQKRVREFYAMSAEDAFLILEAIAEIHGCTGNLKKIEPNEIEIKEEQEAQEIERESRTRSKNFTFSEWKIPIGAVLQYHLDESITCTVVDDRKVMFQGDIMYITGAAKKILGKETGVCGPDYFTYLGAKLWDVEGRQKHE